MAKVLRIDNTTLPKAQESTEAGNRDRFVAAYKGELCYVVEWKQWLKKQGTIWIPATPGDLQERALNITHQIALEADSVKDPNTKAAMLSWAKQSQSRAKLNAMITMSAMWPEIEVSSAQFDGSKNLLATDNEIVNLEREEDECSFESTFWTRKANASRDDKAECSAFKAFLRQVFCGDTELIAWMQLALGYSITGSTEEQVLFMAHGEGSNGKSTLLEVILEVIGGYGRTADVNQFMQRDKHGIRTLEQVAVLKGVRLAVASELEGNSRLNEALLKRLTGGDTLTAARLHKEQFTFIPQFKIWMLMNHLPFTEDNSEGYWRRVRVVPFNAKFKNEQRQIGIKDKLLVERDGILNWLIEGARKWYENKTSTGGSGLGSCKAVERATAEYRAPHDPIQAFINDCTLISSDNAEAAGKLYETYREWAAQNSAAGTLSAPSFAALMASKGFKKRRASAGMMYQGLQLRREA